MAADATSDAVAGGDGETSAAWASADELVTAWRTNHRINEFLIARIDDEGMACTLSTRGGRDVCRQLAHMHNVRVWHVGQRRGRELVAGIETFDGKERPERERLLAALEASTEAVARFLANLVEHRDRHRASKRGLATTFAYLIAHESHHRGSILLTLKQCGRGPGHMDRMRIWDWDRL